MALLDSVTSPRHGHRCASLGQPSSDDMTTVLVGSKQASFRVHRELLCAASPFFDERLRHASPSKPICLWLPGESSAMFALFVEYVHEPSSFSRFVDHAVDTAREAGPRDCDDIHWALVRLHLFASNLDLDRLQDLAMDALQDFYLKCDWDVPLSLIIYLYTQCDAQSAVRIRRWAVAMVAFSLTVGSPSQLLDSDLHASAVLSPDQFRALSHSFPDFALEYSNHLRKMKAARLDLRFKNPQLRISANKLRNDERLFGFRECSFHSHRAAVGEGPCPYRGIRGWSKDASELEMYMKDMIELTTRYAPDMALIPPSPSSRDSRKERKSH